MRYIRYSVEFTAASLGLVLGCREGDAAAIVVSLKTGGAAAQNGVSEGDVVTRIAGRRVGDYDHVLALMAKSERPVLIDFEREEIDESSHENSNTRKESQGSKGPVQARTRPPPPPPPPSERPRRASRDGQGGLPSTQQVPPPIETTDRKSSDRLETQTQLEIWGRQSKSEAVLTPPRRCEEEEVKTTQVVEKKKKSPRITTIQPKAKIQSPGGEKNKTTKESQVVISSKSGWQTTSESAKARGNIAARWEQLRQQHMTQQDSRLKDLKNARTADVTKRLEGLDSEHVKRKVCFFDALFAAALHTAVADSRAMAEKNRDAAKNERERRRHELREQAEKDRRSNRAPRPGIENVAGHPDELKLAVGNAPRGMKLVYTLVDVSQLEAEEEIKSGPAKFKRHQRSSSLAAVGGGAGYVMNQEGSEVVNGERASLAFQPRVEANDSLEALAKGTHTWHAYDGPIKLEEPGTYAVLTKAVPVSADAAAKFEAAARLLEDKNQAPAGYAKLASVLVDAVRYGLIDKSNAFALLQKCADYDSRDSAEAYVQAELRKWTECIARAEEDADPATIEERRKAKKLRRAQRAKILADLAADALHFDMGESDNYFGDDDNISGRLNRRNNFGAIASSGTNVYGMTAASGGTQDNTPNRVVPTQAAELARMLEFEAFADACAADEVDLDLSSNAKAQLAESEISSAVYELSKSPPIMWHEECEGELAYVGDDTQSQRVCAKCGRSGKLYARGDFAICRVCALEGAGVLVDPGARRMWFSQMIEFFPSREIPLPKSHPLLAQILRVLQTNPGIAVRFEGHVNSTCGLDCDGTKQCTSRMCKKIPGGAMGLSQVSITICSNSNFFYLCRRVPMP